MRRPDQRVDALDRWQKKMKRLVYIVFVAIALAAVAGFGSYYLRSSGKFDAAYSVTGEYAAMPEDDSALVAWLGCQKGIVPSTVRIVREGHKIRIFFAAMGNVALLPGLDQAFDRFGYK